MISEKPITALSGVRSSWLILARNVDLARLASSAFWRSSCASRASALIRYSWLSARLERVREAALVLRQLFFLALQRRDVDADGDDAAIGGAALDDVQPFAR